MTVVKHVSQTLLIESEVD